MTENLTENIVLRFNLECPISSQNQTHIIANPVDQIFNSTAYKRKLISNEPKLIKSHSSNKESVDKFPNLK